MTKKETAIFKKYHDEALFAYMTYVIEGETAPIDVIQRACILAQLNKEFFPPDCAEQEIDENCPVQDFDEN